MGKISVCKSIFLFVLSISLAQGQTETFNYKKYIQTQSPTLSASTTSIDAANGNVTINGSDLQQPTTPFTFIWGDNTTTSGFFPQTHKYANTQTTYLAKVIANYSATRKDTADVFIGFNKPVIQFIALDSKLRVYIPASAGVVSTPTNLPPIPDEFFTGDFHGLMPNTFLA
jgi:NADH dehydrogenase FAD-containing subunit